MVTLTSLSESVTFVISNSRRGRDPKKIGSFGMICARLVFTIASGRSTKLSAGTLCTIFPMRNIALKGSAQMKHLTTSLIIGACLLLPSAGVVFADPGGTNTGQPGSGAGNHCGMGGLVAAPGPNMVPAGNASAFNPTATGPNGQPVGGSRYAGNAANPNTIHAQSAAALNGGQYDVACVNQTP